MTNLNLLPTCNQLEKQLSQSIRTLYKKEINHSPQKITCKLFSRYLAIVSDEALTPVEKSLWGSGEQNLSEEIRLEIDSIIKPKLVRLIENITTVKIEEILSNALFAANKSCILVIFSEPPQVRGYKSRPQSKLNQSWNFRGDRKSDRVH